MSEKVAAGDIGRHDEVSFRNIPFVDRELDAVGHADLVVDGAVGRAIRLMRQGKTTGHRESAASSAARTGPLPPGNAGVDVLRAEQNQEETAQDPSQKNQSYPQGNIKEFVRST